MGKINSKQRKKGSGQKKFHTGRKFLFVFKENQVLTGVQDEEGHSWQPKRRMKHKQSYRIRKTYNMFFGATNGLLWLECLL